MGAVAEFVGHSTLEVWVDGVLVSSFVYPLGSSSRQPFVQAVATLAIESGDILQLVGYRDANGSEAAHARVDYVSFTP
jgi:hypothetical protein